MCVLHRLLLSLHAPHVPPNHTHIYIYIEYIQTNANAILGFKFIYEMIQLFKSYFGGKLNIDAIKNNFVLIYELLDEIMDNGVPQVLAPSILKQYVLQEGQSVLGGSGAGSEHSLRQQAQIKNATLQATGAVGWRREGIVYKKNVVYLDVVEQVNLLTSSKGSILKADATGRVIMKTQLSGMPSLKLCVNDVAIMNKTSPSDSGYGSQSPGKSQVVAAGARKPRQTIALDDVTFHQCVNLSQFQSDRIVSFTPPDGEFELMRYRVTDNLALPFKIISNVNEKGRTRIEADVTIKTCFKSHLEAFNIVLKLPVPKWTASAVVKVPVGRAKYNAEKNAIVWKIRSINGQCEVTMTASIDLISATMHDKLQWSRPPISVDFSVPWYSSSSFSIMWLKVRSRWSPCLALAA